MRVSAAMIADPLVPILMSESAGFHFCDQGVLVFIALWIMLSTMCSRECMKRLALSCKRPVMCVNVRWYVSTQGRHSPWYDIWTLCCIQHHINSCCMIKAVCHLQALSAAQQAIAKFDSQGIPWLRPLDYYAEMVGIWFSFFCMSGRLFKFSLWQS